MEGVPTPNDADGGGDDGDDGEDAETDTGEAGHAKDVLPGVLAALGMSHSEKRRSLPLYGQQRGGFPQRHLHLSRQFFDSEDDGSPPRPPMLRRATTSALPAHIHVRPRPGTLTQLSDVQGRSVSAQFRSRILAVAGSGKLNR